MNFKDHFSSQSGDYAAFRPTYPGALFAWLASRCAEHDCAWDCATGSGQAAAGLSPHFKKVVATDASTGQIAHASGPDNVAFQVSQAELSGLEDLCVDLITVAQAAHWFDLPAFYAEVRRVLKPKGVIALWGYGRLVLPDNLDAPFEHFYSGILGPYWPSERKLIDDGYRSLDFPFDEFRAPDFFIEVEWNLPRLLAYLSTWSAVRRYQTNNGVTPLGDLESLLKESWGEPSRPLALKWPLFTRADLLK